MKKSGHAITNCARFINDYSKRRKPSLIRELTKLKATAPPGNIFFAAGMPSASMFPFEEINVTLKDKSSFTLKGQSLEDSLQYMSTQGYPPLIKTLKEYQKRLHSPPQWDNMELIVTSGSQDGLAKVIEMCMEEGHPVLVQDPIYSGTEAILQPFKPQYIPIRQDKDGILPDVLKDALQSRWKVEDMKQNKGVPKLLYICTTGANPSGVNLTTERKRQIYQIACEYDLLILEDDPYYFVHFEKEQPVSFLSMDTECRVVRFDSFSKTVSSGLRVGFTTGPKPIVQRLELHMQATLFHAASLSQVVTHQILEQWGFDKFMDHIKSVQAFYKSKRDMMLASADKHLRGLAEWNVPMGGMFLWIKVLDVKDIYDMIMVRGIKKNVMFVPGHAFMTDGSKPCTYVRASFTIPSAEEIDRGFACLAELIKEEQQLQRV